MNGRSAPSRSSSLRDLCVSYGPRTRRQGRELRRSGAAKRRRSSANPAPAKARPCSRRCGFCRPQAVTAGSVIFEDTDLLDSSAKAARCDPRPAHRDGVSGADVGARSLVYGRRADRRGPAPQGRLVRAAPPRHGRKSCSTSPASPSRSAGFMPIRMNCPAASASASRSPWRSPATRICLIADEPTTALDVTVAAKILDLLAELKQSLGMAMIFISHDLGLVRRIADTIHVMRDGEIVESGRGREIFANPRHDYTRLLAREHAARARRTPRPDAPVLLRAREHQRAIFVARRLVRAPSARSRRSTASASASVRAARSALSGNRAPANRRSPARS